jgi:hypothetical protein
MPHCPETNTDSGAQSAESKMAKVLAPEDLRVGDYVALLHVVREVPSFWLRDGIRAIGPIEPVRIAFMLNNGGVPYRVRSVCLPFVLVKTPSGRSRNLDVRRHRLARLTCAHAQAAWKACKKNHRVRNRV